MLIEEYERTDTVGLEEDNEEEDDGNEDGPSGIKDRLMSFISRKKTSNKESGDDEEDDDIEYEEHEEEEQREEEVQNSFVNKLPFLSAILNKKKNIIETADGSNRNDKTNALGKSAKKKKIEIKLIHIIILIGLAIFAFLPDDKEEAVLTKTLNKEAKPVVAEPTATEPVVEEAKPVVAEPSATEPVVEEAEPVVAEPSATEPVIEEPEAMVSGMGQEIKTQSVDDTISLGDTPSSDGMTDITKKLLGDLEERIKTEKKEQKLVEVLKPVSAPSYEARGPSLVYNCGGQHWACIEPKAFSECRQNYSWNKKNNLPIECYPFADMSDNFDCATIQQEKVDNIGDTSFCK